MAEKASYWSIYKLSDYLKSITEIISFFLSMLLL